MGTVTEAVKTYGAGGDSDIPILLVDAVQTLSEDLLSIPEEYRDNAQVDFEPFYELGEYYSRISVTYERPETADETAARITDDRVHWRNQLREAQARVAYCEDRLWKTP
ncbi:hypothetical protein [Brucella rhizosphaerae]|uniref:hypothetical protein n=1 Tax=Brucella rhizosphaerae TaxID=571254 RepID=UPI0004636C87|nr:hypothetical protein [Brucella rhizosphaerae]